MDGPVAKGRRRGGSSWFLRSQSSNVLILGIPRDINWKRVLVKTEKLDQVIVLWQGQDQDNRL